MVGPIPKFKVLVIEDDVVLASVIRSYLSEEGFQAECTHDGASGLELLRQGTFDLAVIDILMPKMTGLEICEAIRQLNTWMPLILITALSGINEKLQGFNAGADDYIVKPFSLAELAARINANIRRGKKVRPAMLTAGSLSFDPLTRQVWNYGFEIELARREADLFECLIRKAGYVVARRQLLLSVWGSEDAVASNIIDQYVNRLRRKLDKPFGTKSIDTLHSLGYRLRV